MINLYNDEHYSESKISYDGELIPLYDGLKRLKRDKRIQLNYERALTDEDQLTWEEVKEMVENTF